jgi:hypothetical protein
MTVSISSIVVDVFFDSLFYDAFSVTRPYSVDDTVTSEWWWIDEDKHPCLKQDTNPRSQRSSHCGLRLRPRGHWDQPIVVAPRVVYFTFVISGNRSNGCRCSLCTRCYEVVMHSHNSDTKVRSMQKKNSQIINSWNIIHEYFRELNASIQCMQNLGTYDPGLVHVSTGSIIFSI